MDIDQRLRDFHVQKPDAYAVEALLEATVGVTAKRTPLLVRASCLIRRTWKYYFATASLASMLFLIVAFSFHEHGSRNERVERTVREVAMNYMTRLKPEHHGDNLVTLNKGMHLLPFSLKVPEHLKSDYKLVGSRYCSLAGHLAAHVQLIHRSSGELISLFMTSLEPDLEKIGNEYQTLAGVDIKLFNESGLFYALATR